VPDIFISYAHQDRPWASKLATVLGQQGWSVFWDRRIPVGKSFDQVIEQHLDAARCVIVLWSEHSISSDWVKNEASEGARRRILHPALISDVKIPLEFRRLQAARLVDWQPGSPHDEFDQLLGDITRILTLQSSGHTHVLESNRQERMPQERQGNAQAAIEPPSRPSSFGTAAMTSALGTARDDTWLRVWALRMIVPAAVVVLFLVAIGWYQRSSHEQAVTNPDNLASPIKTGPEQQATVRSQSTPSVAPAPATDDAKPVTPLRVAAAPEPVRVRVQTELGDIGVEVDQAKAPGTSANFLKYVDAGHYDGGTWHRTVKMDNQPESTIKIEVIQAGVNPDRATSGFPPIALERTNKTGLLHKNGVISMARGMPDGATSGWFICINDQPSLDFGGMRNPDGQGFAAFGRVVSGMDVVKKIQMAPSSADRKTNTEAQKLTPPIKIVKVSRVQ
jgi:peptidyl-prolyl cis-trans isomerase A (cyclophilin A)